MNMLAWINIVVIPKGYDTKLIRRRDDVVAAGGRIVSGTFTQPLSFSFKN